MRIRAVFLISLLLLLSGCTQSLGVIIYEPETWAISVTGISFHERLTHANPKYTSYVAPGEGYMLVGVSIVAKNISEYGNQLTDFASSWELTDGVRTVRNRRRQIHPIEGERLLEGEIPMRFQPGETKAGNIYFRVPNDFDGSRAMLVFRSWMGASNQVIRFDLSVYPWSATK